jgi:hypothetical protein
MPTPEAHDAIAAIVAVVAVVAARHLRPATGNPRRGYAVHDSEGTIQPGEGCWRPGAPCEVAEL